MAIHTSQTLQQRMVMAPNLTLALRILRMTNLELQTYLRHQMQENPILDIEETNKIEEVESDAPDNSADEFEDWSTYGQNDLGGKASKNQKTAQELSIEQSQTKPLSLYEHLEIQLRCQTLPEKEIHAAELIVQNINQLGYLEVTLEELAQHTDHSIAQFEAALDLVQSLDPPGVGAKDLRDCLKIQLRYLQKEDTLEAQIVDQCFDAFVQNRVDVICRTLHCIPEQVELAIQSLKSLDPKPGQIFSTDISQTIVPDLIIHRREKYYDVELNDHYMPQIMINRMYYRMMRHKETPTEVKQFLHDKFRKASWMIRAIDERNSTLLAIARCLLSLQSEFVEQGPGALKPLTQSQVAQLIGRHASTVSRAIAGKTIDTPFGVYPVEKFFASAVKQGKNGSSKSVSDERIKSEIMRLVEGEDRTHPLSDEALVNLLKEQDLTVARRTIAKYRTALKILPTHLRRLR